MYTWFRNRNALYKAKSNETDFPHYNENTVGNCNDDRAQCNQDNFCIYYAIARIEISPPTKKSEKCGTDLVYGLAHKLHIALSKTNSFAQFQH